MALPYDTDALIKQTQQMLAQTKAEGSKAFAGSAYDTVKSAPLPNPVNTGAINVANLATPATPLNPTTAEPPVYTTPAIPQALVQTDANKSALSGADASLGRIAEYRAQLAGQSSFVEQQKAQQDIIGKQALATQYTNQLNQAKQEAQGIQLQLQTTLQQQQEAARGQGVTAGGLAPHLRASQTTANQALLSNAIKQYGIGASLAAAQGDLTSALDYIDQAVKLQFDPITANLQAELANLDAIKNSSAYTEAEKKRAMALEYQVQQEIAKNEKKKKDSETVYGLALQASQNGADPAIVSNIMKSGSLEDALINGAGWFGTNTAAAIQEYMFAKKNGYTGSFSDYQNEDANRKIAVASAGVSKTVGSLPSHISTQVDKLSSSFDSSPIVKNYNEVQNKKFSVDAILESGVKGPADLALVFEFMKALDPTSVVRESEYETAARSGNIFAGQYARFNGYLSEGGGFLPDKVREDFQELINRKFDIATSQYENLRKETARKINMKTGMDDGVGYLTDYASAFAREDKGATFSAKDMQAWMATPNYNEDVALAREAIANGADPEQVKARLQMKYKDVQL